MVSKGTKIKIVLLLALVCFITILFVLNKTDTTTQSDNVSVNATTNTISTNETKTSLPECADGIDNDGDGKIDYPSDSDCKSLDDNFEKDWSSVLVVVYTLIGVAITGGILYLYVNRDKAKDEETILLKPIDFDRTYDLAISWFLRTKANDMGTDNYTEDDGYVLRKPSNIDNILEINREEDVVPSSGEKYFYTFIDVTGSAKYSGSYMIACSVNRGEEALKKGDFVFRSKTFPENFEKKARTFRKPSSSNIKDQLLSAQLDAIYDGDTEREQKFATIMANQQSQQPQKSYSPYDDMDDNEYKELMRQHLSNNSKKRKPKKKTGVIPYPPSPSVTANSDDTENMLSEGYE